MRHDLRMFWRGLLTCERQGGVGRAAWWVRMGFWLLTRRRSVPRYFLAA